jgi:hypothetical protein
MTSVATCTACAVTSGDSVEISHVHLTGHGEQGPNVVVNGVVTTPPLLR